MSVRKFVLAGVIVLTVFVVIILGLHVGQIRHDRLDYSVSQAFPPDKPFVPGEIYATTLAAVMENEINRFFRRRPHHFPPWGGHMMADNNANPQPPVITAAARTPPCFTCR